MFENAHLSDLCRGYVFCPHSVPAPLLCWKMRGVSERGVTQIFPHGEQKLCPSRLTELCMHLQNPRLLGRPHTSLLAIWFCNDYQRRNPVLRLSKISLNVLWWLTNLYPKTHDSVFKTCLAFIPKVTLHRCMRGGCTGVRPGGPGTVPTAEVTQWDNTGYHRKHINHGSHYQCCQVFVLVIYFQVFCFSNLILSPCCLTVNC